MKKFFVAAMIFNLLAVNVFAKEGGPGGGDPRAEEALSYGRQIAGWLAGHEHPAVEIDVIKLLLNIEEKEKSLDTRSPTIRFQPVDDVTCFEFSKKGCVNTDNSIDLAGKYWEASTTSQHAKCALATIELVRPQQIKNLYEKVDSLCEVFFPSGDATRDLSDPRIVDAQKVFFDKLVGLYEGTFTESSGEVSVARLSIAPQVRDITLADGVIPVPTLSGSLNICLKTSLCFEGHKPENLQDMFNVGVTEFANYDPGTRVLSLSNHQHLVMFLTFDGNKTLSGTISSLIPNVARLEVIKIR